MIVSRFFTLVLTLALSLGLVGTLTADPTDFQERPIPMGVSVSTTPTLPFITAGTAGLKVRSFVAPELTYILSNNHVLGAVGPTLCPNTAERFDSVVQPGTLDLGFDPGPQSEFDVGLVARLIPMDFSPSANNLVDAALAFTTDEFAKSEILDLGEPNPALNSDILAVPGMQVTKSGRTTGVTVGTVQAINVTSNVNFGSTCGVARFVGQVSITPGSFSDGGDSGSSILRTDTAQPVGLLFAGSANATLANNILWVYLITGVIPDSDVVADEGDLTEVPRQEREISRLMKIQAKEEGRVMETPGVTGIGIGQSSDGKGYSFVVYVEKDMKEMRKAIPAKLGGVEVRLIDGGGEFKAR